MSTNLRLTVQKPINPMSLYSPVVNINVASSSFSFLSSQTENFNYIQINQIIYKINHIQNISPGSIELNSAQRENHSLLVNKHCICIPLDKNREDEILSFFVKSIKIKCTSIRSNNRSYDCQELSSVFVKIYESFPISKNQVFYMKIDDEPIKGEIIELTVCGDNRISIDLNKNNMDTGICQSNSSITFVSDNIHIQQDQSNILLENFNFFSLGIGGLKKEFSVMFRRAFLSRVYDSNLIDKLSIEHVKGIILFGPPGTGKTLIARQIGKLLNAKEPKVVNGPEILNKYVGQSEENIRDLFKDAEEDAQRGRKGLHIIIFDEIDAICKKRNSNNNFTDQVVNQLLSKIDGVNSLNNILIIGMTNRIDLIDSALLRPGRFEIHIEIGLPSVHDRQEILEIHTSKLFSSNVVKKDVNLEELAKITNNYTGAELTAVVKSAVSYALERGVKKLKNEEEEEDFREKKEFDQQDGVEIRMEDFEKAVSEVKPSFGLNNDEFQLFNKEYYKIRHFEEILQDIDRKIDQLFNTKYYNTSNFLLCGEKGTGKTSLAVRAALKLSNKDNLYIKLISPRELIGYADYEKIQQIKDIFINGYKSARSIIILDDIESLIDYVPLGPRFSNLVLQTIKTFLRLESRSKCFIVSTCSDKEIIKELDLWNVFDNHLDVKKLQKDDISQLKKQDHVFENIQINNELSIRELLGMLSVEEE